MTDKEKERTVWACIAERRRQHPELREGVGGRMLKEWWGWLRGKLPIVTTGYAVRLALLGVEDALAAARGGGGDV